MKVVEPEPITKAEDKEPSFTMDDNTTDLRQGVSAFDTSKTAPQPDD